MQAYAYIPQTHNQWQLRGKHKFIWGGRDVECTPTQPSSPITRSTQHVERSINMRSVPFPFPCQTGALETRSGMQCSARHGAPYMIYRGREVQHPPSIRRPGIVHALYIKHTIHHTTLFYISIVHIEKICI